VDETLRLIKAFQFVEKHGEGTALLSALELIIIILSIEYSTNNCAIYCLQFALPIGSLIRQPLNRTPSIPKSISTKSTDDEELLKQNESSPGCYHQDNSQQLAASLIVADC